MLSQMVLHRNINEKLAMTLYSNGETQGSCSVAALLMNLWGRKCSPRPTPPPSSTLNNYKYICTQHRSTTICKANANKYEREISNNTIIQDFNISFKPMDSSTKQKINKETQTLNDTVDLLELIDIYRTFHSKTMNSTFF